MTDQTGRRRAEPPAAGDEIATQLGALDRQRATFAWKCGGLDPEGLRATVGVSAITLGGLLKHLALVEDYTFGHKFLGRPLGPPWDAVDWENDSDWEWRSAADHSPAELMALWEGAVERSRAIVAEALAGEGLDTLSPVTWPDGRRPSLRRFVVDMIEEYARHVGHADLIRESVDGLVGEDPPD
ncbi:MAG TPA: DinB family protein [Frankiaceae bacterium]|nr:DinB family protein [Frankiaceae bacterium]